MLKPQRSKKAKPGIMGKVSGKITITRKVKVKKKITTVSHYANGNNSGGANKKEDEILELIKKWKEAPLGSKERAILWNQIEDIAEKRGVKVVTGNANSPAAFKAIEEAIEENPGKQILWVQSDTGKVGYVDKYAFVDAYNKSGIEEYYNERKKYYETEEALEEIERDPELALEYKDMLVKDLGYNDVKEINVKSAEDLAGITGDKNTLYVVHYGNETFLSTGADLKKSYDNYLQEKKKAEKVVEEIEKDPTKALEYKELLKKAGYNDVKEINVKSADDLSGISGDKNTLYVVHYNGKTFLSTGADLKKSYKDYLRKKEEYEARLKEQKQKMEEFFNRVEAFHNQPWDVKVVNNKNYNVDNKNDNFCAGFVHTEIKTYNTCDKLEESIKNTSDIALDTKIDDAYLGTVDLEKALGREPKVKINIDATNDVLYGPHYTDFELKHNYATYDLKKPEEDSTITYAMPAVNIQEINEKMLKNSTDVPAKGFAPFWGEGEEVDEGNVAYQFLESSKEGLDNLLNWAVEEKKIPERIADAIPTIYLGEKIAKHTKTDLDDKLVNVAKKYAELQTAEGIGFFVGLGKGAADVFQFVVDPVKSVHEMKKGITAIADEETRSALIDKTVNTVEGILRGDPMAHAKLGSFAGEVVGQAMTGRVGFKALDEVTGCRIPRIRYVSEHGDILADDGRIINYKGRYVVYETDDVARGIGFARYTDDVSDIIGMRKFRVFDYTPDDALFKIKQTRFDDYFEVFGKKKFKFTARGLMDDSGEFEADFISATDDSLRVGAGKGEIKTEILGSGEKGTTELVKLNEKLIDFEGIKVPEKVIYADDFGNLHAKTVLNPRDFRLSTYEGYVFRSVSNEPPGPPEFEPKIVHIKPYSPNTNKMTSFIDDALNNVDDTLKNIDDALKNADDVLKNTDDIVKKPRKMVKTRTKTGKGNTPTHLLLQKEKQMGVVEVGYVPPMSLEMNMTEIFSSEKAGEWLAVATGLKDIPGRVERQKQSYTQIVRQKEGEKPRQELKFKIEIDGVQKEKITPAQIQVPGFEGNIKQIQPLQIKQMQIGPEKPKIDLINPEIEIFGERHDVMPLQAYKISEETKTKTKTITTGFAFEIPFTRKQTKSRVPPKTKKKPKKKGRSKKKKKKNIYTSVVGDIEKLIGSLF